MDPDAVTDRYVANGRLMEEVADKAGVPLWSLAALVRETSGWLKDGQWRVWILIDIMTDTRWEASVPVASVPRGHF